MSVALGIGGWLLAVTGIGAAAVTRLRLSRHAEAVARACHEVRGPLTAVRLGLEPAARVRQLSHSRLRAIELELGRAGVALDDLSAPAQRHPGRLEPVEVSQLVASSVEAWRPVAAAHRATIALEAAKEPLWVAGERLRLAQAVGNLLANAIEHGGGAVAVRLCLSAGAVRVEVEDSGPGLPAPMDQLVCRRGRSGRPDRGHGLRRGRPERGHGLSIASCVAVAHGGRLAAEPSEQGARIVLQLPAART